MNARGRSPSNDRYTDSSPSERPRTREYKDHSDSYSTDYSDDFEHESRHGSATPPRRRKREVKPARRRNVNPYSSDHSTSHLHSSATSKKSYQSVGGRGYNRQSKRTTGVKKQGWKSHSFSKDNSILKSSRDNITSRMLSAKQRKINEIQNELFDTKQRLDTMEKENRLLKTLQHRQDKALRRFEDAESDLPRLIAQNSDDQRVLKDRLRKTKEAERTLEAKLRENNDEMQKMEGMLRRLKKIVYDKNLGERSELARQLTNTENQLTVTERKLKETEKKLELTLNSFTRQLNSERHKHKVTKEKLEALHEDYLNTKTKLKEKERALDVSNIYSMRKKESSEKALVHSSFVMTPRIDADHMIASATQTDLALTLGSSTKHNDQSVVPANRPLSPDPNSIESSHVKKKEILPSDFRRTIRSPQVASKSPTLIEATKESKFIPSKGLNDLQINSEDKGRTGNKPSIFLTANFESPMSSPNTSFVSNSSRQQADQGSPEIVNSKSNDEQDELSKMLNEAKEQQTLEEERKKMEEARRQKMELLAKMREIEEDKPNASTLDMSNIRSRQTKPVAMNTKSKAELVRSLLGNDNDPVIENLHRGIPSTVDGGKNPDNPEREISFGSYAPTVGGAPTRRKVIPGNKSSKPLSSESENDEPLFDLDSGKRANKSDLLTQLFGNKEKVNGNVITEKSPSFLSDNNQESTILKQKSGLGQENTGTTRAKPVHSGYPWEKNIATSTNLSGNGDSPSLITKRMETSPLIRPVYSANDEDIEELTL